MRAASRPMAAVPDDGEHGGSIQGDAAGAEQSSRAQDRGTLRADGGVVGHAGLMSRATSRHRIPQPVQREVVHCFAELLASLYLTFGLFDGCSLAFE